MTSSYNGIEALEDAWDCVSAHLRPFIKLNVKCLTLFAIAATLAGLCLEQAFGVRRWSAALFGILIIYPLFLPLWRLLNIRLAAKVIGLGRNTDQLSLGIVLRVLVGAVTVPFVITTGLLLLFIPGAVLAYKLSLWIPALGMESEKGVLRAMRNSWTATRGHCPDMYALQAASGFVSPLAILPALIGLYWLPDMPTLAIESSLQWVAWTKAIVLQVWYGIMLGGLMVASVPMDSVALLYAYRRYAPEWCDGEAS